MFDSQARFARARVLRARGDTPHSQAFAAWHWWNHCCDRVPSGKVPLRINLDETALCLFQGHAKGNIFIGKGHKAKQNVARSTTRTHLTHVGLICDDPLVQAVLPQVIIANEKTITVAQFAHLRSRCPPNVRLLRARSAWVDAKTCAQIVRWLGAALKPFMVDRQPILLLDACKAHYNALVLTACATVRVWPVLVPAKMTWLLQPLDTHGFAAYKIHLQKAYQQARIRTADGSVGVAELLESAYAAIHHVLELRDWGPSFDHNGFRASQVGVSGKVLATLQVEAPLTIPSTRPTDETLKACFPKRARVPSARLWRMLEPRVVAVAAPSSSSSSSGLALPVGVPLLAGPRRAAPSYRGPVTRSRSRSMRGVVGVHRGWPCAARDWLRVSRRVSFGPLSWCIIESGLYGCLSACLSVCLSVCLSAFLSFCLSVFLSVCLPVFLSFCLSACLSFCLPVCLPACLPVCLSVSLPVCLFVCLSACLFVCLSVLSVFLSFCLSCLFCLSIWLSACLPVCLSACVPGCLSVCLSVCLSRISTSTIILRSFPRSLVPVVVGC